MKLNLKQFKKIASDEHSTTMKSDAGHSIIISHKGLHPATRGQLAALPMADGGEVSDKKKTLGEMIGYPGSAPTPKPKPTPKYANGGETGVGEVPADGGAPIQADAQAVAAPSDAPAVDPQADNTLQLLQQKAQYLQATNPGMDANAAMIKASQDLSATQSAKASADAAPEIAHESAMASLPQTPANQIQTQQAAPQAAPTQAPQMQGASQPQAAAAQSDPFGTSTTQGAFNAGLQSTVAGLETEAAAAQKQGDAQATLLGKQAGIQAAQQTEYQTKYKALDTERQALMNDIHNKHIDPNHFINTMDGASKISTAIGLIASGMGSAMAGQPNLAADFLHKQIDNDINAQKAELGKSENLLSANMRQFGNMRDAMDMTRMMQTDILANKLKMEAARAQGPMAQANLLKASGQLLMQNAGTMGQMAMRQSLLSGMAKGRVAPESVIMAIVPKEEQAGATKELKEAQGMYRARDNVLSAFDSVAKLSTAGQRVSSPLQNPRQINAIWDPVLAQLSKETAGKFTDKDSEMLNHLKPGIGDSPETVAAKRTQINKLVTEKLNFPELKKWGIDLSNSGQYNSDGIRRGAAAFKKH